MNVVSCPPYNWFPQDNLLEIDNKIIIFFRFIYLKRKWSEVRINFESASISCDWTEDAFPEFLLKETDSILNMTGHEHH